MKKLRWTFGILGAVCVSLFGLLVFALPHREIQAEDAATQRAFAERAFDEMERSLTSILERDDQRSRRGDRATREEAAYGYFELYAEVDYYSNRGHTSLGLDPVPNRALSFASVPLADDIALRTIPGEWAERYDLQPGRTVASSSEIATDVPAYRALAAFNRGGHPRAFENGGYYFSWYEARASRDHVVLYRTLSRHVSEGRSPVRSHRTGHLEGIVFSREALRDWLARETFRDASVESFELFVATDRDAREEEFPFRHRFAEPFDDLVAGLTFTPIASAPSTTYTYVLAALFAIASLGGLFAAYRMAAARIRFAERQDLFVSAVTHELRTPLTTLRMYSEMLRDGIVPEESQREYYDAMVSESERLGRLVDNVLTKAKLAKRPAQTQPADLAPMIEHAVAVLAPHARAKGFELLTSIDAELPRVRADRDAVAQLVVNLVDNAMIHAGPSAEKRVIEVRCERREHRVVLSVRDHGRGVPEELLEDIFEPFVSASPGARGVGLGLALVRSLVSRMGGVVFAENAAGGGLRVTALLSAA